MPSFSIKLNKIAKDVNKYLRVVFSKQKNKSFLIKPMQYSLFSGGKRFRAAIVVNMGKVYNINYNNLIKIGAAVECMHSYSLIHDDLPAMDNDDLRRGKLSTHKQFNEFTAILAGNSLLTLSFEILSSASLKLNESEKNKLVEALASCSGQSGLAGGQYLDLSFENKKVSKTNIINMQQNKTGKLFGFCCESIAIIKKYNLKKRKILINIGIDIGLLFQIKDDLIDYTGKSGTVGKPTKSDLKKGKATLINLIGYDKTILFGNNLKRSIDKKIKIFCRHSKDLLESVNFILDRKF
jgi:farnesyl diphosphate synthase